MPAARHVCSAVSIRRQAGPSPLAFAKGQEILRLKPRSMASDRKDERAFVPFWMRNTNHRRFGDFGVRNRQAFELDRRDPLAPRLDDVLRAIRNLHTTVAVDRGDITREKPA